MIISMKKRKIGYTYGSVSGHFSFRREKSIAFESTLERDLLTILEFNDSVSDVVEQPITIEYTNSNGIRTTYTPDFLVYFNEPKTLNLRLKRKPLLIEVKPIEKLKKHCKELRAKFKVAVKYAHQNDMTFKIFNENRIRTVALKNILFLKRYKNYLYNKDDEDNILSYISAMGGTRIGIVLEYLFVTEEQKRIGLGQIWNLLANKKLLCEMNSGLNLYTEVFVSENIEFEDIYNEKG